MFSAPSSRRRLALVVLAFLAACGACTSWAMPAKPKRSKTSDRPATRAATSAPKKTDRDRDRLSDELEPVLASTKTGRVPVIVRLDADPTPAAVSRLRSVGTLRSLERLPSADAVALQATVRQARALARLRGVRRVEEDATTRAANASAQAGFGVTKARLDVPSLDGDADGDAARYTRDDLVAAIVDSGIDTSHPDLDRGKVLAFEDLVGGRTAAYDDFGHGTHVAGTIGGAGDRTADGRGVAPGAALVGVKVLDETGEAPMSRVIAGLEWTIAHRAELGIEVVNLSVSSDVCSDGGDALSAAVDAAADAGLVVTAASGNSGPGPCTIGTPGAARGAITSGAMADPGAKGFGLADFSGRGPTADGRAKPDLVAPGVQITAASPGDGYRSESGTSAASAFTAGVALLLLDADPSLTPATVRERLTASARDWGADGPDPDFGAGRLDAYAALAAAGAALSAPPALPDHARFAGTLTAEAATATHVVAVKSRRFPVALTLTVPSEDDFDLVVEGPGGRTWTSHTPAGRHESLTFDPPETGDYSVRVEAFRGAGDYLLDVSAATTAPPATETPGGGDPAVAAPPAAPRTWRSPYDWPAGHGSEGWSSTSTSADAGAYGFAPALPTYGAQPGLWVWPTGDREYRPAAAEWRFQAPGTTRIVDARFDVHFRNKLLAHHCVGVGLRHAGDARATERHCKPLDAPAPPEQLAVTLADPGAAATQAWAGVDMPVCNNPADKPCSKNIPSLDPTKTGAHARVASADLTLVDDDAPVTTVDGAFYELDQRYIDGRGHYGLRVRAADAGAGLRSLRADRLGGARLLFRETECDPSHRTAALGSRLCAATDEVGGDVDTNAFPEGANRFEAVSTDHVEHPSAPVRWSVFVDRTAPPAPSFGWADSDEERGGSEITWEAVGDPSLPDGHAGSGLARYEYRFGIDADPSGEFLTTTEPELFVAGVTGPARIELDVTVVDRVGNRAPVRRHSLVVDGGEVADVPRLGAFDPDAPEVTPDFGEPDEAHFCEPFEVPGVFRDDCDAPNAALAAALAEPSLIAQRLQPGRGRDGGYGISDQFGDHRSRGAGGVNTASQAARGFRSTQFTNLAIGKARIVIPWDLIFRPVGDGHRVRFERWMAATRVARLERLVSFEKRPEDDTDGDGVADEIPSAAAYDAAVTAFTNRYSRSSSSRDYVKYYTAWNEPNNRSQATSTDPVAAARYFRNLNTRCQRRACAAVAGDFLDSAVDRYPAYIADYRRALRMTPRLWGWHPYRDARRGNQGRLDDFLERTRCTRGGCSQPEVWLTEGNGVTVHPRPPAAPEVRTTAQTAASLEHIIDTANTASGDPRADRRRVKRLYVYHWMGGRTPDWDSGLFRLNGTCRPTYNVLLRHSNPGAAQPSCPTTPV